LEEIEESMRKNLEIEQKYNARTITPNKFKESCNGKNPITVITVSGYDTFYSHPTDDKSFFRYRERDSEWELTFKRQLYNGDSVVRIEHNLRLNKSASNYGYDFCRDMGYEYNFTIFKTAFIYEYLVYIACYYIVYDTNLVELGRFIEIELKENVDWKSESDARAALNNIEKGYKELGINSLNRVKDSLFELFRTRK
jgi:adenylate cyclase class IV